METENVWSSESSAALHDDTQQASGYTSTAFDADNVRVSSHDEPLILVDGNDNVVGSKPKLACHVGSGLLHRALSLHVINPKGQVLIQKRAEEKLLWPGYWSNSCCSHPHYGESMEDAVHRRAYQELGLKVEIRYLYKFQYRAAYKELGTEHEICSVFVGFTDDEPVANPTEVADWHYMDRQEITDLLALEPERFTPWFHMEWRELTSNHPGLFKA